MKIALETPRKQYEMAREMGSEIEKKHNYSGMVALNVRGLRVNETDPATEQLLSGPPETTDNEERTDSSIRMLINVYFFGSVSPSSGVESARLFHSESVPRYLQAPAKKSDKWPTSWPSSRPLLLHADRIRPRSTAMLRSSDRLAPPRGVGSAFFHIRAQFTPDAVRVREVLR
jgi:hypothetical protein